MANAIRNLFEPCINQIVRPNSCLPNTITEFNSVRSRIANTGRTYSDDDGDGLSNQEEILTGTSPTNPDTDADGVSDGEEVASGTDPLDDMSFPTLDSDQDGIEDAYDYCADTEAGAYVNEQGCSGAQIIAQMCQCAGPSDNKAWKSHGQYVSCVARARNAVFKTGLITEEEGEIIVETAAESSCGKK